MFDRRGSAAVGIRGGILYHIVNIIYILLYEYYKPPQVQTCNVISTLALLLDMILYMAVYYIMLYYIILRKFIYYYMNIINRRRCIYVHVISSLARPVTAMGAVHE